MVIILKNILRAIQGRGIMWICFLCTSFVSIAGAAVLVSYLPSYLNFMIIPMMFCCMLWIHETAIIRSKGWMWKSVLALSVVLGSIQAGLGAKYICLCSEWMHSKHNAIFIADIIGVLMAAIYFSLPFIFYKKIKQGEDDYLKECNAALKANPQDERAWYAKAQLLHLMGDLSGAVDCYNNGLEHDTKNIIVLSAKGNLLEKMQCYQASLLAFEESNKIRHSWIIASRIWFLKRKLKKHKNLKQIN